MLFKRPDDQKASTAWWLVAGWSVIIFLTIPFARAIQLFFERLLGSHFYLLAASIVGLFFTIVVLVYIFRRNKKFIYRRVAWLVVLMSFAVWVMRSQLQTPGEAIHFFEYGILSYLLFCAWCHHVRNKLVYPLAVMSLMLIASFDEFLQWMVPGRYWDFRDIRLNVLAGVTIQCFIGLVIHPSAIRSTIDSRSVRIFCVFAWMTILVFGFTVSNTPARVDLYASRIPFLRFLANNESVMSEYGYRYRDPAVGVFYSRMTLRDLRRIDHDRGQEAGDLVLRYQGFMDYREFLQTFTSSVDPFVHEMRVHMHRRDHYFTTAWQYREKDPDRFKFHLTVAFRENQLLQRYFPTALKAAQAEWDPQREEQVRALMNPDLDYTSPVSDHLVTLATEFELWLLLIALTLAVGYFYRRYGRDVTKTEINHVA